MPAPAVGNELVLKMGFTNNEAQATTISGGTNGLANVDDGHDVQVAASRGGAAPIRKRIYRSPNFTLTCDRNSVTKALFDPEHNGDTIYIWEYPDGDGSGNPKQAGSGILQASRSAPTEGPMEYAVDVFMSGDWTYTTV